MQQSGMGHIRQSGMGHIRQTGMDHIRQTGMDHIGQTGMGHIQPKVCKWGSYGRRGVVVGVGTRQTGGESLGIRV
jgi:hypothetical protein